MDLTRLQSLTGRHRGSFGAAEEGHIAAWWPIHPIGFPIGANAMMNTVWFSVFLAWLIKRIVLRFGGAAAYGHSQHMFLGLIAGQVSCNGLWLVIDFFSGKVGNAIFWV